MRVRFAPSPTGFLHVGGGRTAMYNWLFARRSGGTMVLRSDDTDQARSTAEFADDIIASMEWLDLDWDEGIGKGGPHGTYRQSDRLDRYRTVAEQLVAEGKAYYSFATPEQLDAFRKEAQKAGLPPAYDGRFDLDRDANAARVAAGEQAPIRFAVPRPGVTEFVDIVRDDVRFDHVQVDDFVILRSDGSPTYHLASTVDDVDYEITHVIRGEDLLSSTPKHIALTLAMGADAVTYAHLPLLMGPDGSKLSKRHGHTAVGAYRTDGYLPEALNNYLAILSWSPGEDEEIVTRDTMVERFDLNDVSKNPAVFDVTKLEWMNGMYIRELPTEAFIERATPHVERALDRSLTDTDRERFAALAPLVQERTKLMTEIAPQLLFLFGDIEYDEKSWNKVMTKEHTPAALAGGIAALEHIETWDTASIEAALRDMLADLELSASKGLQPLRVAVCGSSISPPLFESLDVLGRDTALERLATAASMLG